MTITLYGIPNCDQVRKARAWLAARGLDYAFHDFKKAGISPALAQSWLAALPWETLVNRKGTTWRGLPEERKAQVSDPSSAAALMQESPSVVKRPILAAGGNIYAGFSEDLYQSIFTP